MSYVILTPGYQLRMLKKTNFLCTKILEYVALTWRHDPWSIKKKPFCATKVLEDFALKSVYISLDLGQSMR